jgi:hypothetical protein
MMPAFFPSMGKDILSSKGKGGHKQTYQDNGKGAKT